MCKFMSGRASYISYMFYTYQRGKQTNAMCYSKISTKKLTPFYKKLSKKL